MNLLLLLSVRTFCFRPAVRLSSIHRLCAPSWPQECFLGTNASDVLHHNRTELNSKVILVAFRMITRGGMKTLASHCNISCWHGDRVLRALHHLSREQHSLSEEVPRLSVAERVAQKKKRLQRLALRKEMKKQRWTSRFMKKVLLSHEEKLLQKIDRAQKKLTELREELKKLESAHLSMLDRAHEHENGKQHIYLHEVGWSYKNGVSVDRSEILQRVVQNMHLRWKSHRLVRVHCGKLSLEVVKAVGRQLTRLSGGTIVDIQGGETIVFYRGKNHRNDTTQEDATINQTALLMNKCKQAIKSYETNLQQYQIELKLFQEQKPEEAAGT